MFMGAEYDVFYDREFAILFREPMPLDKISAQSELRYANRGIIRIVI